MIDVKRQAGHLKIADAALRRIKKYCCKKKNKRHYRKRKKIQSIL